MKDLRSQITLTVVENAMIDIDNTGQERYTFNEEQFGLLIDNLVKNLALSGVVGSKDVQLMRDALLKSREDTARAREASAIQQTLEIYCNHDELPTVNEVLERIGRKH